MNLLFKSLLVVIAVSVVGASLAQACECIAAPNTKKYQEYTKTWYGTKRKWSCEYTCQDAQQRRTVITGYHSNWYTSDKGLEGICDGLHYAYQYNTSLNDFIWFYKESRWFDSKTATNPEVKTWAKNNCR